VIFMENHGVLVGGSDARECLALHDDWVARCETYFSAVAKPVSSAPAPSSAALRKTLAELRRAGQVAYGGSAFVRFSGDKELTAAAYGSAADLFAAGSL